MDLGGGSAAMAAGLGGDIDLLSGGLDIITGNPTAPSVQVYLNRNLKYCMLVEIINPKLLYF